MQTKILTPLLFSLLLSSAVAQTQPAVGVIYSDPDLKGRGVSFPEPTDDFFPDSSGPSIDFVFGDRSLGRTGSNSATPRNNYSIRWNAVAVGKTNETYTLRTITDDGVRLYVDGQLVIDQWEDAGRRQHTTPVQIEQGKSYLFTMEMRELTGASEAHLYWSSPSISTEAIPFEFSSKFPQPTRILRGNPEEQVVFSDPLDIPNTERTLGTSVDEPTDSIDISRIIVNSYEDAFSFIYELDSANGPWVYFSDGRRNSGVRRWDTDPGEGYNLFLDTDKSGGTGYRVYSIGAEFVIKGRRLYRYTGNGTSWSWEPVAYTWLERGNDFSPSSLIQQVVKREWLGNPSGFNMIFYGDNAAESGGSNTDVAPNNAGEGGFYTYNENGPSGGDAITFDGNIQDWRGYASIYPEDDNERYVAPIDLRLMLFDNSETTYNFAYWMNRSNVDWNGGYMLFLDTNRNLNSGYPVFGRKAEYMIRDFRVWRYSGGTSGAWSWDFLGNAEFLIGGKTVELRFPKNWLGNQLPGTRFDLKFYGDTGFNSNVEVYPEGGAWLEYFLQ